MRVRRRLSSRLLVASVAVAGLATTAVVAAAPTLADTAPPAGTPATVSADPLPTVQVNGVVWAQVVVGNTVFATGSFTRARPAGSAPGQNEVVRNNLLAYDIRTGALIAGFNHSLNAQGLAIAASPDGTRVYVGGDFTRVDTLTKNRIAAFDTRSFALSGGFAPSLDARVSALAVTSTRVFVGGSFSTGNGLARGHLAAFATPAGGMSRWDPEADASVLAMTMSPDGTRVFAGGRFSRLGGAARLGIGPVDTGFGAAASWPATFPIRDWGNNAAIYSLSHDTKNVYMTGYDFNGGAQGNFEGRAGANPTTGALTFIDDCHGDSYSTFPIGQVLYSASHSHNCATIGAFPETSPRTHHFALASTTYATGTVKTNTESGYTNWAGNPAPTQLAWYPTFTTGTASGQGQSTWSVSGNSTYVVFGGEFPMVNSIKQQGLVRFAIKTAAPNRLGPVTSVTPTSVSGRPAARTVRVVWRNTWDEDNGSLIYDVFRDGRIVFTSAGINSRFWSLNSSYFDDKNVPAGRHTYTIRVRDVFGNSKSGSGLSTTV